MAKAYPVLSSVLKRATSPRETSMVCGWGTLPFSTATAKSLYQRCNASAMLSSKGPRAVRLPVMLTTGVVDGLSDTSAIPPLLISLSRLVPLNYQPPTDVERLDVVCAICQWAQGSDAYPPG